MPRSLRALRTALSHSCFGNDFAKAVLIRRQRVEKSASPGSVQIACKWFGNTTDALISNGYLWRVLAIDSRSESI